MKKTTLLRSSLLLLLALLLVFSAVACGKVPKTGSWESATYRSDKSFGDGAKALMITVKADEESIILTVHSDKETVGAALLEHDLIAGEESIYGLYVKTVNGMTADYDTDGYYWAFYQNGEYMLTGVDSTPFSDGDAFELVKTKG